MELIAGRLRSKARRSAARVGHHHEDWQLQTLRHLQTLVGAIQALLFNKHALKPLPWTARANVCICIFIFRVLARASVCGSLPFLPLCFSLSLSVYVYRETWV